MANTKIVDEPTLHQLRMEKSLFDRLTEMAEERRMSRNALIIELIERVLG